MSRIVLVNSGENQIPWRVSDTVGRKKKRKEERKKEFEREREKGREKERISVDNRETMGEKKSSYHDSQPLRCTLTGGCKDGSQALRKKMTRFEGKTKIKIP